MHDFLLAKEIAEALKREAKKRDIENISKANIEVGSIKMSHDGHPEHLEDIDEKNLLFGLESLSKNKPILGTKYSIKKVAGDNWKIVDIEI